MSNGWIKLHRRAFSNPHLRKPNYFYVFMFLCSEANHNEEFDRDYIFQGKRLKLNRGQCLVSQKQISIDSKIALGSVNRILKVLETEMMIETCSDRRSTLVTIKNYCHYQEAETTIETKLKPNGNQMETHKNKRTKEQEKEHDTNVSRPRESINFDDVVSYWNHHAQKAGIPQVQAITDSRRQKIKQRIKADPEFLKHFGEAIQKIGNSDFLSGRQGNWKATFDWFIANDKNYVKVLEGNYDGNKMEQILNDGQQYAARMQQIKKSLGYAN